MSWQSNDGLYNIAFDFDASNSDVVETILGLANNEIDEEMLVNWFRVNSSEILKPET